LAATERNNLIVRPVVKTGCPDAYERAAVLLKEAAKLLRPSKPEAAASLAESVGALVDGLLRSVQPGSADDKAFGSSVAALLPLAQDSATAMPAVLLQPAFVMALGRLSAAASKGAVVSYDPLSHHLVAEASESPSQVRIVRPGVQVLRPDGSARVLVAALVAAI
jgi:hypothetical protein